MTRARVAIAHDYLTQRGGAERVVLAIARAFPGARIHTSVYEPDGTYPEFADLEVVTTPLQRVAPLRRDPRRAQPVLAPVVGRHRIDADLVVASSSGWAHGFDTDGRVLVYCHAPARWLYQPENYLGGPRWRSPKGLALAALTGNRGRLVATDGDPRRLAPIHERLRRAKAQAEVRTPRGGRGRAAQHPAVLRRELHVEHDVVPADPALTDVGHDLLDQRELRIDKLAALVGATVHSWAWRIDDKVLAELPRIVRLLVWFL